MVSTPEKGGGEGGGGVHLCVGSSPNGSFSLSIPVLAGNAVTLPQKIDNSDETRRPRADAGKVCLCHLFER